MTARLLVRFVVVDDETETTQDRRDFESEIASPILAQHTVALSSGFNALSPPSGATHVLIEPVSGAVTWTLKGVTGDTGIALAAASTLPTRPVCIPLGTSPALGITTNGAGVVRVFWF